jgi:hypothetical protein
MKNNKLVESIYLLILFNFCLASLESITEEFESEIDSFATKIS